MHIGLRGSRLIVVAAAIALVTTLPMSALPLLHDIGSDDSCMPRVELHDVSAHHIRKAGSPVHAPHCAICHSWQSESRFKRSHLASTIIAFVDIGRVVMAQVAEPGLIANAIQSARAPPAS